MLNLLIAKRRHDRWWQDRWLGQALYAVTSELLVMATLAIAGFDGSPGSNVKTGSVGRSPAKWVRALDKNIGGEIVLLGQPPKSGQ